MLSLWYTSSPLYGPELLVRAPFMIPDSSPVMRAVDEGDLQELKSLVAHGKESPYDVDESGMSFLTVGVTKTQSKRCSC